MSQIDWKPGHKLQSREYTIREKLGAGAYGVTYKADYKNLNKDFVIKVPNSGRIRRLNSIKDKHIVEFYKKEAILLAELEYHPHIVRVVDAFEEVFGTNKIPVIVMDIIEGKNLFEIIESEKPLSEDKAVKYIYQIGRAIDYLHRHELIHCDVHPGNIMINNNDEAVLIDFGLAQKMSAQKMALQQYPGHPNFIPHEQKTGQYNYTADIYALAASLYYIVTGDPPQASPLEPCLRGGEIKLSKPISEPLKKAILKGMELEPSDRPQSMSEWLNMLPGTENYRSSGHGVLKLPLIAISVLGMDSQEFERLIQEEEWFGADIETFKRVCQVNGEYQRGGLSPTELIKFMNEHLKPINNIYKLWHRPRHEV